MGSKNQRRRMKVGRRRFLKTGLAAAGAAAYGPFVARAASSKPLRLAAIGSSGQCIAHYDWMAREKVVALCDADTRWFHEANEEYTKRHKNLKGAADTFPDARLTDDYRELFEGPDDFDAVLVCTPDHHHFPAVMRALRAGKAVFCEKPLTWGVEEAQQLADETARRRLPTQMGNQGMGGNGWRLAHAYYNAGAIGQVREVHAWTGVMDERFGTAGLDRPEGKDKVPSSLNWDVWLGAAPARPYKKGVYDNRKWRQWSDFGGGSLGDFGCHTLNVMFKLLDPSYPTSVETVKSTGFNGESFPEKRIIKWGFPAEGDRPAFDTYWYDGGLKPPRPKELEADRNLPWGGCLFIGTEGTMLVPGSHNSTAVLIPDSRRKAFGRPKMLAPKSRGHYKEFVQAAKGEIPWDAPLSNFKFSGRMTGIIQLGNAAMRASKPLLEIDSETRRVTNLPGAENPLARKPRPGWYL